MRKSNHIILREILRAQADGATLKEMAESTRINIDSIRQALLTMPDAYIDRWEKVPYSWAAVWCVVAVPGHCPRPDPQGKRPKREPVAPVYKAKPCALQQAWGARA